MISKNHSIPIVLNYKDLQTIISAIAESNNVYIVKKGKTDWEYYYASYSHKVTRRKTRSSLSRNSIEEEAYRYVVGQFRLPDTAYLFYMESIPEHFLFRVTTSGRIYLLHQYRGESYLLYPRVPGEAAFPMDGDW